MRLPIKRFGIIVGIAAQMLTASPVASAQQAAPPAAAEEGVNPDPPPAAVDKAAPAPRPAAPLADARPDTDAATREAMCLMIESAARAHDLPLEFFARVIWQESRFQADAIGPVTRNGRRALGIAQFMPGTADERRLLDPFDPVQALPKSAEFLSELRSQFGNLGLAAAAYNAGPRRVQEWIAGTGPMPQQTRQYVYAITGSSVEDWAATAKSAKPPEPAPATNCRDLMALLKRAPNPFVTQLAQRVQLGVNRAWGVQLAGGFNRDRALGSYARAVSKLTGIIGDRDTNLLSSVYRSRGTRAFYQVRVGVDTREEANTLCGRILRTGHGCLVLRNTNVRS
jgi:soluble lytic murein transglycosylase-like protein